MSMCTCANGCDRHPMADPGVFPPCRCWCHEPVLVGTTWYEAMNLERDAAKKEKAKAK